jgi:exodeoxyribonuclease-5
MPITLSTDQANALDQIVNWYTALDTDIHHCDGNILGGRFDTNCPPEPHTHGGGGPAPVYALGGWAGTGKTTLVKVLEDELGIEAVFGTPTHKAAAVLRKKLPPEQAARVRTYHSLVYRMHAVFHCAVTGNRVRRIVDNCTCKQADACHCPARFDPCTPKKNHTCRIREELSPERREVLGGHRELVIVDESSMLSREQVEDIRYFGIPILLVGDNGQLPPVQAEMNQWMCNPDVQLTEIHRQGADSGILQAARDVRLNGSMRQLRYGRGDTVRMPFSNPEMGGVLERWNHGPDRLIVTYTNKLRAMWNDHMREPGTVRKGDRVVALGGQVYDALRVTMNGDTIETTGNSSFLQVHNGMTGTVRTIMDTGGPTIDMVVQLDDHELATDDEPVCLLVAACARAQFGAERDLWVNSPDRPKGSRLWDYAYALTAHKAQGSEFDQVMVMDDLPPNYAQWLYTSITRAKKACLVVDYRK